MQLTLKQISEIVGGKLAGDTDKIITGVGSLAEAKDNEITFLGNRKYTHFLKDCKAGAILFPEDLDSAEYSGKNLIILKDPQVAFAKLLTIIDQERLAKIKPAISPKASVADTAVIGKNVAIGHNVVIEDNSVISDNTKILPNTFIGSDVVIGKNCLIYPNVTIREKTKIGDNCIIHAGAVIGADGFGFINTGKDIYKIPQIGHVEIGNNVEIGANTTVDRAAIGKTVIADNTKIDNLVMIAHNVQVGKNTMIVAQVGIAGSTQIGDNVVLGGQVGIAGHIKVGNNVTAGAKSGITSSVEDNRIVSGFPLQTYRENLKTQAVIRKLPEIYDQIKTILKKIKKEEE